MRSLNSPRSKAPESLGRPREEASVAVRPWSHRMSCGPSILGLLLLAGTLGCTSPGHAQQPRPTSGASQTVSASQPQVVRPPSSHDDVLAATLRLEDVRDEEGLLGLFRSLPAAHRGRERVVRALGRIQDLRLLPFFAGLWQDAQPGVRGEAVFALGQLADAHAGAALSEVFEHAPGSRAWDEVRLLAVEGLGKCVVPGDPGFRALTRALEDGDSRVRELACTGLGIVAWRCKKMSPHTWQLASDDLERLLACLGPARPQREQRAALYALYRCASAKVLPAAAGPAVAKVVASLTGAKSESLRLGAVQALAALDAFARTPTALVASSGSAPHHEACLEAASCDGSAMVRVAAAEALVRGGSLNPTQGKRLLADPHILVRTALLRALLEAPEGLARPLWTDVQARYRLPNEAPMVRAQALRLLVRLECTAGAVGTLAHKTPSRVYDWLAAAARANEPWLRKAAASACGEIPTPTYTSIVSTNQAPDYATPEGHATSFLGDLALKLAVGLLQDPIPAVRSAAADSLGRLAAHQAQAREALEQGLGDADCVVAASCAEALASARCKGSAALVARTLKKLKPDTDVEVLTTFLEALGQLGDASQGEVVRVWFLHASPVVRASAKEACKALGVACDAGKVPPHQAAVHEADPDEHATLARLMERCEQARSGHLPRVRVSTNRGSFELTLTPDDAPRTVDSFLGLAKKGYFKGLSFHRVVPAFVTQGGDPRGDGSGGPGYTLRCEYNALRYERGMVGMALAGKDTGGSQWFVTHTWQPHLDGRFTVFGYVSKGLEVVEALGEGDTMNRVDELP